MYKLLAIILIFFASQSFVADTKFYFDKSFRAKRHEVCQNNASRSGKRRMLDELKRN